MSTVCRALFFPCLVGLFVSVAYSQPEPTPKYLAAYAEMGGAGAILSLNGELFLNQRIAFRAGVGTMLFGATFPMTINFLSGAKHRFEFGAGIVYATGEFISDFESTLITATIGYRYQPATGDWLFRAGFTPLFNPDTDKFLPWLGISGGIAF